MIKLLEVTKKFGEITAINKMSLSISRGEVVGFLGPNGAGKTTAMRLIIGYLAATSGRVLVGGKDPQEEGITVRSHIGYLPENNPLYPDLKTSEYLNFIAQVKGISAEKKKEALERIVDTCAVREVYGKIIGELSRGYKQRVGLAAALLGNPPILILDEPTSGLDPNQIIEIRKLIKDLGQEKTVILSTHIIPEVSQTCSRVVIINRGEIAADKGVGDFGGEEEFHRLTQERQI